ncbi:hypothetical protein QCA50_006164 [Cerrena zonata]|uniref:NAD-dependent epimerase/dehydratase domain-containing protein n=1 Tax=Cerrena zonata TaxID=2478898 RepID=A0AAW0GE13_9APHY
MSNSKLILVTGATGFIGAHVVNELLSRGHKVRAVARSKAKAEQMIKDRPQYAGFLDFVYINDLATPGIFDDAVKGVDGIIHVASPVPSPETKDLENDIMVPAINGAKSMLEAAKKEPKVKRIVLTSSMAAVMLGSRGISPGYTYTSDDWNPITYEEGKSNFMVAYQAAKTFAEKAAWDCIKNDKPQFDLVTFCFPFVLGLSFTLSPRPRTLMSRTRGFGPLLQGQTPYRSVLLPPGSTFVTLPTPMSRLCSSPRWATAASLSAHQERFRTRWLRTSYERNLIGLKRWLLRVSQVHPRRRPVTWIGRLRPRRWT